MALAAILFKPQYVNWDLGMSIVLSGMFIFKSSGLIYLHATIICESSPTTTVYIINSSPPSAAYMRVASMNRVSIGSDIMDMSL